MAEPREDVLREALTDLATAATRVFPVKYSAGDKHDQLIASTNRALHLLALQDTAAEGRWWLYRSKNAGRWNVTDFPPSAESIAGIMDYEVIEVEEVR